MNGAQQLASAAVFVAAMLIGAFLAAGRRSPALVVWVVLLAYLVTAP